MTRLIYNIIVSVSISFFLSPSVSVRLWNQHGVDLTTLKWERHRVAVTYHPISDDFFESDVDELVCCMGAIYNCGAWSHCSCMDYTINTMNVAQKQYSAILII